MKHKNAFLSCLFIAKIYSCYQIYWLVWLAFVVPFLNDLVENMYYTSTGYFLRSLRGYDFCSCWEFLNFLQIKHKNDFFPYC